MVTYPPGAQKCITLNQVDLDETKEVANSSRKITLNFVTLNQVDLDETTMSMMSTDSHLTNSIRLLPRKSVRLTWENKSVYTEFVPTFRNFDFFLGSVDL